MSDRVQKIDYFYVMVPNKAGQAAKVLAGLAAQGVNLLAFSGFPSGGKGQLDLVPEDAGRLRRAAKKLNLKLSKKKSGFLLQGADRVGWEIAAGHLSSLQQLADSLDLVYGFAHA